MLDLVYITKPGAYRAEPLPRLGYSNHISELLIPAYKLLIRRSRPATKRGRPGQKEPSLPTRTVLNAVTGTFLGRQQLPMAPLTWMSTWHQLLALSASALMTSLSSRPSPHTQTKAVDDCRGTCTAESQRHSLQSRR